MANDWSVISKGDSIGLGFKFTLNADISGYNENTYGKDIFKHTADELKLVDEVAAKEVKKILNG
jgi:hypothetical protein